MKGAQFGLDTQGSPGNGSTFLNSSLLRRGG